VLAAFAFHRMALPITIPYSSVATSVVGGISCKGALGSVAVFRLGYVVAVSVMVGRYGEDLFANLE
jgi:hypothetical protein